MISIIFDTMIYDLLAAHSTISKRINALCHERELRVLVTPMIVKQLNESPFRGVPDLFPVEYTGESVFLAGGSAGDRVGKGLVYKAHICKSKQQWKDALIADAADCDADVLVSNDKRFIKRMQVLSKRCKVLNFEEFQSWLDAKFSLANTAL